MKNLKVIILYALIAIYILITNIIEINTNILNYIINPVFWIMLFGLSFIFNKDRFERIKYKTNKIQTIFIIVVVYLMLFFISGLLVGYARNPLNNSILGILKNSWVYLIPIVFMEYTRYYSVNSNKNLLNYIIIIILFTLSSINIRYMLGLNLEEFFKYASSTILPNLANSIFLVYISKNCGYFGNLFYMLPLSIIKIILPILPDYDWFFTSVSSLLLTVVTYIFVKNVNDKAEFEHERRNFKKHSIIKSIVVLVPSILLVCFVSGILKYRPVGIISNSMKPLISRGDVVVVEKVDKKSVKTIKNYDIIVYMLDKVAIAHRVINIEEHNDGTILLTTMGDNNNAPDPKKVKTNQIVGKVKFKIPYLGYPSIYLKELFDKNKTKPIVETGK